MVGTLPTAITTVLGLVGDWIVACFGEIPDIIGSFVSDTSGWLVLFMLVIPLSGLIFTFVKSLIARK